VKGPWFAAWLLLILGVTLQGCPRRLDRAAVTVYCALDQPHSEALLRAFERSTGLTLKVRWDTEASKTTGLVNRLMAEASAPRCDVFWNNEPSQMVLLAQKGLLSPYESPARSGLVASCQGKRGLWSGFAARARVLLVNRAALPEAERPRRLLDLLSPALKGRVGIARPFFGTTATHAAAMFAGWGPRRAEAFFDGLIANDVVVCAGNAQVKDRVVAGELACGLTDTDDANLARASGADVEVIFPDQGAAGSGALLIPNAVGIIAGGPNPTGARRLVDYLLSAEVERRLAASRSAQIPLREGLERPGWFPADLRFESVDWRRAGERFTRAQSYLQKAFTR
jgi:iron(III) transport system substrate-binding protein